MPFWLDVSLLGRDFGDFPGTLGTFVTLDTFFALGTLGTFQHHASGVIHQATCIIKKVGSERRCSTRPPFLIFQISDRKWKQ